MAKLLLEWLGDKDFSETQIPFSAIATDLISGQPIILNQGKIVPAVRASMSIPTMFQPIVYQEKILVDGGISNPVPADVVRQMGADIVIAVNLDNYQKNSRFKSTDAKKVTSVMGRGIEIMRHYLAERSKLSADIVLEPKLNSNEPELWRNYFLKKNFGGEIVLGGVTVTKENLNAITNLINK